MRNYDDYIQTAVVAETLQMHAKNGDIVGLERLLATCSSHINERDAKGYSPLMYAAYHAHEHAVKLLLSHGADPDSKDTAGNSILMGVAFKGHTQIARLLLEAGASPNARNKHGQSALDFAQMFGRKHVARILTNNASHTSNSIFQFAISWSRYVRKLIWKGAST